MQSVYSMLKVLVVLGVFKRKILLFLYNLLADHREEVITWVTF